MRLTPQQRVAPHRSIKTIVTLLIACISPLSAAYAQSNWKPGSGLPLPSSELPSSLIDRMASESGIDTQPLWDETKSLMSSLRPMLSDLPTPISLGNCRESMECETACQEFATENWFSGRYSLVRDSSCHPPDGDLISEWPIPPELERICACSLEELNLSPQEPLSSEPTALDFMCKIRATEPTPRGNSNYSYWAAPELRTYGGSVTLANLGGGISLTHPGYYSESGDNPTLGFGLGVRISTPFGPVFFECFYVREINLPQRL